MGMLITMCVHVYVDLFIYVCVDLCVDTRGTAWRTACDQHGHGVAQHSTRQAVFMAIEFSKSSYVFLRFFLRGCTFLGEGEGGSHSSDGPVLPLCALVVGLVGAPARMGCGYSAQVAVAPRLGVS